MTSSNRQIHPARRISRLSVAALSGVCIVGLALPGCASSSPREAQTLESPSVARDRAIDLVAQGVRAAKAGNEEQALVLYTQAVNTDPKLFNAWNNLGELLLRRGEHARAAQAFRQSAELEPTDPRPYYNVGLTYQRIGWAQDALEAFRLALKRDPAHLPSLRGVTRAAEMLQFADELALEHVRSGQLYETDPVWRGYFQRQRFRVEAGLRSLENDE